MDKQPTISVCMIVKNEENLLEACLQSVRDFVQEIVIVDTGSTDSTIDIAEKYSAKTYSFPWDNSFSNARNFSISKATCEWILLMDADERIVQQDVEKLLDFIKTTDLDGGHFKVYNYVGQGNSNDYTLHFALRLFRNNGTYHFVGDIHEQLCRIDEQKILNKFANLDVRLNHYGYLDKVVKEKDKRKRNIPILLKQLEGNPDSSFILFNLGNEYLAEGDYKKALQTYQKATSNININEAYAPHLIFRSSMCLYNLKQYREAVIALNDGLKIYTSCTDMEYLKGLVFVDWKRYTMAIDSFNKALEMGEAPSALCFTDNCGTTKPLLALGRLYMKMHDYEKALYYFTKLLNSDNTLYFVLYYIGNILKKTCESHELIESRLTEYFSSLTHLPNLIIIVDILIEQQLTGSAKKYLELMQPLEENEIDKKFLNAKFDFYTGNYEGANTLFSEIIAEENASTILPNAVRCSTLYLFVVALMNDPEKAKDILELVYKNCGELTGKVYSQAYNVVNNIDEKTLPDNEQSENILVVFTELLNMVIRTQKFELFEKLLYVYNYIDSNKVLLSLAQIYYNNGYYKLAEETVIRSINQLNTIDEQGVELLYSSYFEH